MKQRIITGAVLVVFLVAALLLMNTFVFPVFVAFLSAVAVWEIEKAVGLKNKMIMAVTLVVAVAIPFLTHFGVFLPIGAFASIYVVLVFILMLIKFEITKFEETVVAMFASVCVPYSFSLLIIFRDIHSYIHSYTKVDGVFLILFAIVASWLTDVFAYFVGSFLGKHKLCPKISPKKSVEGAIGGVVGATLINVLLFFIFNKFFFEKGTGFTYLSVVILSVILSIISMFGDLSASTIKRNFGIKDFGNLLPGHGGIMDRFDSMLFVMPVLYGAIYIIEMF